MSYAERRQHPRRPATYAVELSAETADGVRVTIAGNLHDISDSGISFVSRSSIDFQPGQKVGVSILAETENAAGRALHAKGEVMWIEYSRLESDQVLIGLRLDDLIESEALASGS